MLQITLKMPEDKEIQKLYTEVQAGVISAWNAMPSPIKSTIKECLICPRVNPSSMNPYIISVELKIFPHIEMLGSELVIYNDAQFFVYCFEKEVVHQTENEFWRVVASSLKTRLSDIKREANIIASAIA